MGEQVLGLAVVRSDAGGLNMHKSDSSLSPVIDKLEPGTVVRVFERRPNGWWLIGAQRKGEAEECGWAVGRYLAWQPAPRREPGPPPKRGLDPLDELDRINPWPWLCVAFILAVIAVVLFWR